MLRRNIVVGSVFRTDDGAFWYACGDWRLSGVEDAYPCILAYVPAHEAPRGLQGGKRLVIGHDEFVKVFGHHGLELNVYRGTLLHSRASMIVSVSMSRAVFVKASRIVEMRDPRIYLRRFLSNLEGARTIFQSLARILGVPMNALGLSGSNLVLGEFAWRHENDVIVYGKRNGRRAFKKIRQGRRTGIFSAASMAPFHTPFQYRGQWIDPLFDESPRRRHFLHGASMKGLGTVSGKTFTITEDRDGIFFPAVYRLSGGRRLISFRVSRRGLFHTGQRVTFGSLTIIHLRYRNDQTETAYAVLNDEWATPH